MTHNDTPPDRKKIIWAAGRDRQRAPRRRVCAPHLGEPAADQHSDEPGQGGRHRSEQRNVGVGEPADVGEVLVRERDDGPLKRLVNNATTASRTKRLPVVLEHVTRPPAHDVGPSGEPRCSGRSRGGAVRPTAPAGSSRPPSANGMRHAPRGQVGEREGDDREREAEPRREREHRRRVRPGAFGCFFDDGEERDGAGGADKPPLQHLRGRERKRFGAMADNAHTIAEPTTPMRIDRRRPRRSAMAMAKSANSAPSRVSAERDADGRVRCVETVADRAVNCPKSAAENETMATVAAEAVAMNIDCSGLNATGGSPTTVFGGRGLGRPSERRRGSSRRHGPERGGGRWRRAAGRTSRRTGCRSSRST